MWEMSGQNNSTTCRLLTSTSGSATTAAPVVSRLSQAAIISVIPTWYSRTHRFRSSSRQVFEHTRLSCSQFRALATRDRRHDQLIRFNAPRWSDNDTNSVYTIAARGLEWHTRKAAQISQLAQFPRRFTIPPRAAVPNLPCKQPNCPPQRRTRRIFRKHNFGVTFLGIGQVDEVRLSSL